MPNKLVCTLNPYTFSDAKLKQFALMFDELTTGKTWLEADPNKQLYNKDNGTAINYLVQQQILHSDEFYEDETKEAEKNWLNKHGKEFETKGDELDKMYGLLKEVGLKKAVFAMNERKEVEAVFKGYSDLLNISNSKYIDLYSSDPNIIFTPMITGHGFDPTFLEIIKSAVPKETFDAAPFFAKEKSDITRIVLSKLPVPAEDTPWEDVIGFKQYSKTQEQIRRLRRWMRTANENQLDEKRVSEEIEYLLEDYENHMSKYLKKHKLSRIEAAFATPLGIVEDIVKINWSNIPNRFFKIAHQKIDLDIAESTCKGNEVAYIHSARKTFGTE